MKFTLRQFTDKGLATVATVNGSHEDLAKVAVKVQTSDWDAEYPLAELIEASMENEASDNGFTEEEIADQKWENYTDFVSDHIMHTNAPFIYNGHNRQITQYNPKVYAWIEAEAVRQCKIYFDKEDVTEVTETTPSTSKSRVSGLRSKANYPGIYFRPTKADPKRWVAYGIEKGMIIGYFQSEKQAFDAKKKANQFVKDVKWIAKK